MLNKPVTGAFFNVKHYALFIELHLKVYQEFIYDGSDRFRRQRAKLDDAIEPVAEFWRKGF